MRQSATHETSQRNRAEADHQISGSRNSRKRLVLVVAIAAGMVVSCIGGAAAMYFMRSPQQVLASTQAPARSDITATVQKRALKSSVVARATVRDKGTVSVAYPAGSRQGAAQSVVTHLAVKAGDEVRACQVIAEVSGRPVFAVSNPYPFYRDLRIGHTGPDVVALKRILNDCGVRVDKAESFDATTAAALSQFYSKRRFTAPQVERDLGNDAEGPQPQKKQTPNVGADTRQSAQPSGYFAHQEFLTIKALPATVQDVGVVVGDALRDQQIRLGRNEFEGVLNLSAGQASQVRPGMLVELVPPQGEAAGTIIRGTVERWESQNEKSQGDADARSDIGEGKRALLALNGEVPSDLRNQEFRATVTTGAETPESLVVPATALFSGHDHTVKVIKVVGGKRHDVTVTVSQIAEGFASIATKPDGAGLVEGDAVLVGTQQSMKS